MSQFFLSNPTLQEDIKFDPMYIEDEPLNLNNNPSNPPKNLLDHIGTPPSHKIPLNDSSSPSKKEKQNDFSKYWGTLSKEIMRNTHKGLKMPPTLESVNNRLNIFRAKIEKVDHLELLAKESSREKKSLKSGKNLEKKDEDKKENSAHKDPYAKTSPEEGIISFSNEEDDIVYYSFKKKMQLALHKRKEMEKAENEKRAKNAQKKGGKGDEINDTEGSKKYGAFYRSGESVTFDDKRKEEKNIEFQTPIGQGFYEILKQSGDDTEHFRKMANTFVSNYNKKVKMELHNMKKKNFPPQIPKFTAEETKNLNILLPDYTIFLPNKSNIFQNLEDVKPAINTPEYECMKTINKILDGKLINFWKTCQNN